ncbi:hypothetical protein C8D77_102509 [Mesorhizobium loti]|uniref:Uncharacterized protein n=1 Tax=Rhizobium loti TaxID=381 RepID=A0A8E3B621_RHILI|nr:hypothetical protein C8D77_102509 [Mesorhizobium loti]
MKYDKPRGHLFSLPKPWLEVRQALRDSVVRAAGEIRTHYDGQLIRVHGLWEVVKSGTHNDADVVQRAAEGEL